MAEDTVLDAQSQSGDVTDATGVDDTQTTGTEEPTGTEGGTDNQTAEGDPEGPIVPEEYADFTMPEGVEMNAELLDAFKPVAKELGLTQEAAQKLVDLQTGWVQAEAKAREDAYSSVQKEWEEANKKDPEYGGAKWEQTKEAVGKLVFRLGGKEAQDFLNDTGAGESPAMVRLFYRVSQLVAEDTHVGEGGSEHRQKTLAEKMYPEMYENNQ